MEPPLSPRSGDHRCALAHPHLPRRTLPPAATPAALPPSPRRLQASAPSSSPFGSKSRSHQTLDRRLRRSRHRRRHPVSRSTSAPMSSSPSPTVTSITGPFSVGATSIPSTADPGHRRLHPPHQPSMALSALLEKRNQRRKRGSLRCREGRRRRKYWADEGLIQLSDAVQRRCSEFLVQVVDRTSWSTSCEGCLWSFWVGEIER